MTAEAYIGVNLFLGENYKSKYNNKDKVIEIDRMDIL